MLKNTRSYARKKPIFKEKSFIRDFFDGENSSDTTLIDTCSKAIQDHSSSGNKENIPNHISHSPVLFECSYSEKARLPADQKGNYAKKIGPSKGIKAIKKNKNLKKKEKQIQHFSTKHYQSIQPRWSEILSHDFVVQNLRNGNFREKDYRNKPLSSAGVITGLNENINKRNVEPSYSSENKTVKSPHFPKFLIQDDSFDSSGDLFLKPKSIGIKKKLKFRGQQNVNCKSKIKNHQRSSKDSLVLREHKSSNRVNKNESVLKRNKTSRHLYSQELSSCSSGDLFSTNIKKSKIVKDLSQGKCILNLGQQHNLNSKSTDAKLENNCSLSIQNSKKDTLSQIKDVSNDVQNSYSQIQNCDNLVTNFSKTISCFSDCKENTKNVSKCSLVENKTSCKEKSNLFTLNEFNKSKNSFQTLDLSISSNESDSYSNKYSNDGQKRKILSTNLRSSHNTALEILQLANASFGDDFDIARKAGNKKENVYDSKISSIGFSPLDVNKNKFLQTFSTSTPVIKNKSLAHFSINSLDMSANRNENTRKPFSSYLKYLSNLYKTSLMSNHIKESSKIKACTVSGKSSKSHVSKNSYASSKNNRSLINRFSQSTSLSMKESNEFTKAKLLQLCNQEFAASFSDIYDWNILKVKKIGEGTYGEVFTITKSKLSYVLKVIPVSENSDDCFQDLQSVLSEIQISKCLSELRDNEINKTKNFTLVRRALVVYGSYPLKLLDAWDDFKQTKSCYNNRPDVFGDNQLFVILELEYGGKDMSCFVLRNALEAESILKQIAVSLAVAEEEFLFEHRDLHLGNILVERVKRKNISYKLRGKDVSFACHGVHVTVIDFTLSHLYKDGYMYYYDLAEEESLFEQSGDCQFDVYKSMRKHLRNQWQECSLYSNVLWLKYLCKKLNEFNYSRPSTAAHIKGLKGIETFSCDLMRCKCAFDTLTKCGIAEVNFGKSALHADISKKSILVARNSTLKSKINA